MSQNYKDTLNLPRTDFPMKANLAQREPELLKRWEETGVYRQIQKSCENAELFVLHDGPPFANRSEEHTSELQSRFDLVCRLLLEKKKKSQRKYRRRRSCREELPAKT